jgi:hypothetical protein
LIDGCDYLMAGILIEDRESALVHNFLARATELREPPAPQMTSLPPGWPVMPARGQLRLSVAGWTGVGRGGRALRPCPYTKRTETRIRLPVTCPRFSYGTGGMQPEPPVSQWQAGFSGPPITCAVVLTTTRPALTSPWRKSRNAVSLWRLIE